MFAKHIRLLAASVLGVCALATLIWLLSANLGPSPEPPVAYAVASVHYVAPGGNCGGPTPCYAGLQEAVDAAASGDEIRVAAGTYTATHHRGAYSFDEVVYISKTLAIQGGYTTTNWTSANPSTNPSILDAQFAGLVMVIDGSNGYFYPNIAGLSFTRGSAPYYSNFSGGIYAQSASVTLFNNQIFNNHGCLGGGVYVLLGTALLISNTISGNTACDGGGVLVASGSANLMGNTISGNDASLGGGVYVYRTYTTLSKNTIRNNYGYRAHGVYVFAGNDVLLDGNTISGNGSDGTDIDESTATVNNNIISSNFGAGVSTSYSYVTLNGNVINSNQGRGVDFHKGAAALSNNTIYRNSGYGVYLYALDDAQLLHNTIAYNYRGLYQYRRNATLIGNLISHNGNWGAAHSVAMFSPNPADQLLVNNVIADNSGDVSVGGSNPRLLHTTLARNGGGLSVVSGAALLTNTILVNEPVGISVTAGSTATLNGVLWFGNGTDTAGAGTINIANPFNGDPAFAADDYHLTAASAAIDRGVVAGITTDIDGLHRPSGAAPDLGAVEYYLLDHHAYLPAVAH